MAMPLMTTTLPTVIGMGVVSHATDTMFGGRKQRTYRSSSAKPARNKPTHSYIVYFKYTDRYGNPHSAHARVIATNVTEAKNLTIRGERPRRIAVDRVKRV